ncbi:hypothetical protein ES703_14113 [subsurface metagenome]|nr:hypothetical protein [Dehalococcoidia bacterium]
MYAKTEAAYLILKDYKKPLHVREIIRIALANGMFETKGKTPELSLSASIYSENKLRTQKGESLRFCRIGKETWGLIEWGLEPIKPKVSKWVRRG